MKTEQLYNNLKELAERLDISVSEQSFKNVGLKVKSGLCKVNGKKLFIMDKNKSLRVKTDILATCLADFSLEDLFIVPAVREVLDRYRAKAKRGKAKKRPATEMEAGKTPDEPAKEPRHEKSGLQTDDTKKFT